MLEDYRLQVPQESAIDAALIGKALDEVRSNPEQQEVIIGRYAADFARTKTAEIYPGLRGAGPDMLQEVYYTDVFPYATYESERQTRGAFVRGMRTNKRNVQNGLITTDLLLDLHRVRPEDIDHIKTHGGQIAFDENTEGLPGLPVIRATSEIVREVPIEKVYFVKLAQEFVDRASKMIETSAPSSKIAIQ